MVRAPKVIKTYVGRKGKYEHRRCPYSTTDITERIPVAEQTDHLDTQGRMDLISGPTGTGSAYRCNSNYCSFYLGTAVTEIDQSINNLTISGGQYIYTETLEPISICSGTRFQEY